MNASQFTDPDGDTLYLTVRWGDGAHDHIRCGACRLEHAYRRGRSYKLDASVTDLKTIVYAPTITVAAR